ncbi:MAG: hypothetical protein K8I60_03120, partial [Anaerolineae bacterium]|nr:hypothetical protein [Anaerolineae bacterium]
FVHRVLGLRVSPIAESLTGSKANSQTASNPAFWGETITHDKSDYHEVIFQNALLRENKAF